MKIPPYEDTLSRILFSGSEAQCCNCSFSDCQDYWMAGHRETGEYHVVPLGMVGGHNIFCDMDEGGWIVIYYHIFYLYNYRVRVFMLKITQMYSLLCRSWRRWECILTQVADKIYGTISIMYSSYTTRLTRNYGDDVIDRSTSPIFGTESIMESIALNHI